jgi:glycosyltransferase 2 family protein
MNTKPIIISLKCLVVLLIFFFIFKFLYLNINSLSAYPIHFDYINLLYASIFYFLFSINNTIIWYLITKLNACNIDLFETIKLRVYAEFGKYIPGKIFSYGILLYSYEKRAISKKIIGLCSFQELIISNLAVIIISLISIFFTNIPELNKYKIFFIIILSFCFLILHPKILLPISNFLLKLLKKESMETPFSFWNTFFVLFLYTINWLFFGLAFYFFINSIIVFSFNNYFYSTGAFALSGLIGFLAIFAPAGLGVREGVLILTLSYIIPSAVASIIAITSRIWITIADIIIFLAIFILSKLKITFSKNKLSP